MSLYYVDNTVKEDVYLRRRENQPQRAYHVGKADIFDRANAGAEESFIMSAYVSKLNEGT